MMKLTLLLISLCSVAQAADVAKIEPLAVGSTSATSTASSKVNSAPNPSTSGTPSTALSGNIDTKGNGMGASLNPNAVVPLTSAEIDALFASSIDEFVLKLRDPFKMPDVEIKAAEIKTDLEKYPLSDFKYIGLLTGPKRVRAMLQLSDGKTYFVSERMKIGQAGGIIRRISPEGIFVREKMTNAVGQVENLDSTIVFAEADDGKKSSQDSAVQDPHLQQGRIPGAPGQ